MGDKRQRARIRDVLRLCLEANAIRAASYINKDILGSKCDATVLGVDFDMGIEKGVKSLEKRT